MARLIPNVDVETIKVKPERDVARALVQHLPNDVIVLHSYPWLHAGRNKRNVSPTLYEGEVDFLVIWPDEGLLFIEVKGGAIDYLANERRWIRVLGTRDKLIKDPFEQARSSHHKIVGDIRKKLYNGGQPPFTHGHAVVFPDCVYKGAVPPGAHAAIILSASDLSSIDKSVKKALRHWSRKPYKMDKEERDRVQRVILPLFHIVPSLSRTIEGQEEELVRLTDQQSNLVGVLSNQRRAAIEGVAGSGKTMLAKLRAEQFAEQDIRTLMVCYNRQLANWLKRSIPKAYTKLIDVHTFHDLCKKLCDQAGIAFDVPDNDPSFWTERTPELLADAVETLRLHYQAIVVDEGQDIHSLWWYPLELLLDDTDSKGFFYVFYDPAQGLYHDGEVSIPDFGAPYPLKTNCRNTQSIAQTCAHILSVDIDVLSDAPEGLKTEFVVKAQDKTKIQLNSWLQAWFTEHGVQPGQVAILSPSQFSKSSIAGVDTLGGKPLVHDIEQWQRGEGTLFSTIRGFKGLESDVLVLIDVIKPGSSRRFSKADYYVACSRAKHILKIVCDNEELRQELDIEN